MLRDNPDRVDVENGNALNAAVDDLNNPKIGSAALRAAHLPVAASLIAEIREIPSGHVHPQHVEDFFKSLNLAKKQPGTSAQPPKPGTVQ